MRLRDLLKRVVDLMDEKSLEKLWVDELKAPLVDVYGLGAMDGTYQYDCSDGKFHSEDNSLDCIPGYISNVHLKKE